jgi:PDZ domain-containing protein
VVPDPARPGRLRVSGLWWFSGPVLVVLVSVVSLVLALPSSYYALLPGSATAVEPLVTVTAVDDEPLEIDETTDEGLFFLTVTLRQPSGFETLLRTLDGTAEVVPEQQITGGQSREENRQFNLALMTDSKDRATKVALERAGFEVPVTLTGAVVLDLDPTFPVADAVRPGETIVSLDGAEIASSERLRDVILEREPGEAVELALEAFGEEEPRTVTTRLGSAPEDPSVARLGVTPGDRPRFEFPVQVDIDSGPVGGPSAGLAFTLAILDRITPGDLVGDDGVAVTGSIDLDGSVGTVGGVPQKTEAAIRTGAEVFLVPAEELQEGREAARGRIDVRPVSTLDEALAVLEEFGGDGLPEASPLPGAEAGTETGS